MSTIMGLGIWKMFFLGFSITIEEAKDDSGTPTSLAIVVIQRNLSWSNYLTMGRTSCFMLKIPRSMLSRKDTCTGSARIQRGNPKNENITTKGLDYGLDEIEKTVLTCRNRWQPVRLAVVAPFSISIFSFVTASSKHRNTYSH